MKHDWPGPSVRGAVVNPLQLFALGACCLAAVTLGRAEVARVRADAATQQAGSFTGSQARDAETVRRFAREPNPIALTSCAASSYMEASGRRAAFLGRADGGFEAWVYPLKVLHDFQLRFGTEDYAEPIPSSSLVAGVDVRPEASAVRYSHAAFTVDAVWFVPIDSAGGLVLLDIDTSKTLTIEVRFRADLKPMWPAALGGQYSYWDDTIRAYVVGEASRTHAALVGSPLGLRPPEQPAHNLPDAPSQFTLTVSPETARSGLVPIVIAASVEGLDAAKKTYADLLTNVAAQYGATAAHYRRLRAELTSVDTPDDRLDLAFEWGKVAFDKGFVCNPHLGCGLVAGLGPSGTTERPGFGWFFGGDMFINSWAITSYGDFETVRRSLEFLRKHQRADGKMPHEISQGAAYIKWFDEFPYAYYHADTTPLYISALRDYVDASGDLEFARAAWPSVKQAYAYCATTDEDGDGLMDNTRAGLAAVETGSLRRRDILTDVFLAAVWTDATRAAASLASMVGDAEFAARAAEAHEKARASFSRRFADDERRRVYYAVLKDGTAQAEPTVWPAVGLWRHVLDLRAPTLAGALDEIAGAGIAADWGARMLSRDSALYEPLSYNNGAVWPFLSGYATLALYRHGRPDAGWAYLEALSALPFLESCGYTMELLSGDRLRSIDAAVPHQLFATAGFMSGFMRGLVGLDQPVDAGAGLSDALTLKPVLPAGWTFLKLRNLRWRDRAADLEIERTGTLVRVTIEPRGGELPVRLSLVMPPGAEPRSVDLAVTVRRRETFTRAVRPGIEVQPVHRPLKPGDRSGRLRILEAAFSGETYRVRYEARAGVPYRVTVAVPVEPQSIEGAKRVGGRGSTIELEILPRPGEGEWTRGEFALRFPKR